MPASTVTSEHIVVALGSTTEAGRVPVHADALMEKDPLRAMSVLLKLFYRRREEDVCFVMLGLAARAMILAGGGMSTCGVGLTEILRHRMEQAPLAAEVARALRMILCENQAIIDSRNFQ